MARRSLRRPPQRLRAKRPTHTTCSEQNQYAVALLEGPLAAAPPSSSPPANAVFARATNCARLGALLRGDHMTRWRGAKQARRRTSAIPYPPPLPLDATARSTYSIAAPVASDAAAAAARTYVRMSVRRSFLCRTRVPATARTTRNSRYLAYQQRSTRQRAKIA